LSTGTEGESALVGELLCEKSAAEKIVSKRLTVFMMLRDQHAPLVGKVAIEIVLTKFVSR
jgi:hypothetical protein